MGTFFLRWTGCHWENIFFGWISKCLFDINQHTPNTAKKKSDKKCDCWTKNHSQMRFDVALYFGFAKSSLFLFFLVCHCNSTPNTNTQFINGSSMTNEIKTFAFVSFILVLSLNFFHSLCYCYCFCSNAANVFFIFSKKVSTNQIHVDETSFGFINLHNALFFI